MKYLVNLLLLLSLMGSPDLLSQQWLKQRVLDKYNTQQDELSFSSDDEYASAEESEYLRKSHLDDISGNDCDDFVYYSSSDSDNDMTDELNREFLIVRLFKNEKIFLEPQEYEQMASLTKNLNRDEIEKLVKQSIKKTQGIKKDAISFFYLKILKNLQKDSSYKNIALPDFFKKSYITYLNKKYKLNFPEQFLDKTFSSVALTSNEIKSVFLRTSYKLGNLKSDESLEQVIVQNLSKYADCSGLNTPDSPVSNGTQKALKNSLNIADDCLVDQRNNIFQLKVADQTESFQGEEDMNCGYHALKNGILIANAINAKDDASLIINSLQDNFLDAEFMIKYCPWKKIVIDNRTRSKIANLIYDILVLRLRNIENIVNENPVHIIEELKIKLKSSDRWLILRPVANIRELTIYLSSFVNVAKKIASKVRVQTVESWQEFDSKEEICGSQITEAITDELNRQAKINRDSRNIYLNLTSKEKVSEFFKSLDKIDVIFSKKSITCKKSKSRAFNNIYSAIIFGIAESLSSKKDSIEDEYETHCDWDQDNIGDWLDREEIQSLIQDGPIGYLKKAHPDNISYIIVGDLSKNNSLQDQLSLESDIKSKLLDRKTKIKVIICFTQNHWITCVINTISNGFEYYVANSWKNGNIVDLPIINQIKEFLEQTQISRTTESESSPKIDPFVNESNDQFTGHKSKELFKKPDANFSKFYCEIPQRVQEIVRAWNLVAFSSNQSLSLPDSVILYGESGTGKSLLAQAIAGQMDAYFYHIVGSNMLKPHYGESEELLKNIFEDALDVANASERPVVIFIDEVNGVTDDSKESARRDILHAIHAILDNKIYKNKVLLIGATNSLDIGNTYISRSRTNMIYMGQPDQEKIRQIIIGLSSEFEIDLSEQSINTLARKMKDMAPREVKSVFNLAREKHFIGPKLISMEVYLEEALDYYKMEKQETDAFATKSKRSKQWEDAKNSFINGLGNAAASATVNLTGAALKGAAKHFFGEKKDK